MTGQKNTKRKRESGASPKKNAGAADNLVLISADEVRQIVRDEIKSVIEEQIKPTLTKLQEEVKRVEDLKPRVEEVERSLQFQVGMMDDIYDRVIPKMTAHTEAIANALTKRILDMDVHGRKWSLNINGLAGAAEENITQTRKACVDLATKHLKVNDATAEDFAACHRLKPAANAGIIVRFTDLDKRNMWLNNAKNLKGTEADEVGLSPDLPPVLRPIKKQLLNIRRELPAEVKRRTHIRYLKSWPYLELRKPDSDPVRPPDDYIDTVVKEVLGFPARLEAGA